jgi:hypothetical protein
MAKNLRLYKKREEDIFYHERNYLLTEAINDILNIEIKN